MRDLLFPNCCGSEDGQLAVGVDVGVDQEAMVHVWKCNTCEVVTVVSQVLMDRSRSRG